MIEVNRTDEIRKNYTALMKQIAELPIEISDIQNLKQKFTEFFVSIEENAAREGIRHGREEILQKLTDDLNEFLEEPKTLN